MAFPPAVGWSASAFVASMLARLIRKGLELLPDLDDAAAGHLRRLEGLLPAVWRVLDAADAGAIDIGGRALQELLDAAYAADDGLDDVECALHGVGDRCDGEAPWSPIAATVARKPRSPLRFLLCFSPPRTSVGSRAHGKSCKAKNDNVNLDGLGDALETLAQAAYRCTSTYEHVEPGKNYATFVAGGRGEAAEHDNGIFGKEAEVEQILENVRSSDDPHYRLGIGILPVSGDAGVGKTALVRYVFHHEVVQAEFPVRMWVHVSGALCLGKKLIHQMIHGGTAVHNNVQVDDDFRELLVEELAGRRFLLVLDDVTDIADTQWRDLMEMLSPAARKSLVMVTTQSTTAARAIGTMPTLPLGPLGFRDCFKMLKHYALGSTDESEECTLFDDDWDGALSDESEEWSPMEQIASELAKKMAGLPLPARALGRALHFRKDDEGHWRSVMEGAIWEHQDAGGISPALWLSYRHLDPRLKQCFAYCAVFPGDYVFTREEVVQMWVAQGLLYSDLAATRLEDVGGELFDELVDRRFIQITNGKNGYVMYNSMQQLARRVATSRFFMVTDDSGDVPQEVCHLTISTNNLSKLKQDLAVQISPVPADRRHFLYRVRTILFCAEFSDPDDFVDTLASVFSMTKSLRVLGLSSANITYFPPEMGLLRRLRYLNLSGNKIIDLPETLCRLYHLQVLDMRSNPPSLRPPDRISDLIHLRHLRASDLFLSSIQGIHNLSNLQQLDVFRVGGTTRLTALGKMKQLRGMLRIGDLSRIDASQEVKKGILLGMQELDALQLSWGRCHGQTNVISRDEEVLECLQPHEDLRVLRITGYGGVKIPSWLMKISGTALLNLTEMYLTDCTNCKSLPPLHVLPNLEVLEIRKMHSLCKVTSVPQRPDQELFPKLKRLIFEGVPICTEWSTGNSKLRSTTALFPSLCELEIRNCPMLTTFPDLPLSLAAMVVENADLELLPGIQDKQPSQEEALAAPSNTEGRWWTSRLTTLQVHQCHRLRSLGSGLLQQQHLLKSLETLSIKNCDNVICDIPEGFEDLTALRDISLYDCPKMLVGKFHTSVRTFEISECFVARGGWVQDHPFLFSVWKLKITGCSHISTSDQDNRIEPLDWLNSLLNAYSLHLENTRILRLSMFDLLPSLEILDVNGCDDFFSDLYDFSWLERLQTLGIINCKEMSGLPENLCTLPELEELCIENCPAIEELPENGLPTSLKRLSISKCGPRLTERCLGDGTDWPKIAKIDVVYFDGRCIQAKPQADT
jgi:hypothetical protein